MSGDERITKFKNQKTIVTPAQAGTSPPKNKIRAANPKTDA